MAVLLLQPILHILAGPVLHPPLQRFPDGFWRGWVFVCGHLLWCVTRCLQALFEEDFGGCQVAVLTEAYIDQVAEQVDFS